jgi:hypothetical protein
MKSDSLTCSLRTLIKEGLFSPMYVCLSKEMAHRYLTDFHGTCFKFFVIKQNKYATLSSHQVPLGLEEYTKITV